MPLRKFPSTLKKCDRKFRFTWCKQQRKRNVPYQKRINEDKVTIFAGDDEYVNVLDNSKDTSDSHNKSFHDTSFNLTISHITEEHDAKVCAGNNNPNGNDDSSFFNESCRKLGGNNLIKTLLQKMNEENLLQHFMAFVDGICSGIISVSNISILLCLEYCYLMSLNTTTQIRYRDETCKFWECVRNIGGSKLIRLFSSDKYFGKLLSEECDKNKYVPTCGSFNFAVPDDKVLHKSKTNIPRTIEPGIINESLLLIDKSKEIVLSLDGK